MNRIGIGLEQRITTSLQQKLVITPQLQQAIKLLQLNHVELAEMLQEELLENPILEEQDSDEDQQEQKLAERGEVEPAENVEEGPEIEGDPLNDIDWESYFEDMDFSRSALPSNREHFDADLPPIEARLTPEETLYDHLLAQLHLVKIPKDNLQMALFIIGSLNEDGWLLPENPSKDYPEDILDSLTQHMVEQERKLGTDASPFANESMEESLAYWREIAEEALEAVQKLEPSGVGARSLQESLLIQSKHRDDLDDPELIQRLIQDHLPQLERHSFKAIAKKIKISLEEVIRAQEVIRSFEPRPGRSFSSEPPPYITPDIYLKKIGDEYTVSLHDDGLPQLKISGFYKKAMKEKTLKNGKEFVQEKLRNATWLLRSIHQRRRTIYKVTESIIKRQKDFLDKGVQYLKPMILKDVAEDIEMHESTISRVTSNKYVHTPQGVFELKFFFTSSIQSSKGGEDLSSLSVKEKIKLMVSKEDSKRPLSDQTIVRLLKQEGIQIARRTVAKYRTQLSIPSSNRRKKLY